MNDFSFKSNLAPKFYAYIKHRKAEGYSIRSRIYYLCEFDNLLFEKFNYDYVTQEAITEWDKQKPFLSNRTKISRHNTIRAFSVYANARDGVSFVPETSKLKSTSTFRPHIFTKDELSRIFYSADHLPVRNNAPFRHFIIPAVFRLLYCCGFRIGEVVSLKIQDIDFENNVIYIKNAKGGKERLVPISDGLALYLQDYLSHISKDSEWLFPSLFGHYATGTIYGHL